MYQGARRPGQVLSVNDKRGMFKMRFYEFPTAEFDYSFSYKSSAWSYIGAPPPQPSIGLAVNDNEPLCTIAKKLKALIQVNFDFCVVQMKIVSCCSLCYHQIGT